jgi:hypothetical protein
VWSAAYQPTAVEPDSYSVAFSEDHAQIVRRDGTIGIRLDVAVSSEDDAEVRQITISNRGARTARAGDHLLSRGGAGLPGGGAAPTRRSPSSS